MSRTKQAAPGFTLLELLIALVLSGVLMAGLWGLLATYQDLFSRGEAKVENAQLLRALFEQLAQDLECAIPDSPAGLPGQAASARRFGLFGTQNALQVDVLRQSQEELVSGSGAEDGLAEEGRSARLPELHTVQYLFQQSDDWDELGGETLQGLVRRELDWETPADGRSSGAPGPSSGKSFLAKVSSLASSSLDPMDISAANLDPDDHSLLWVPEVVGLEFRYYDGSSWASQWNSLTRKSLPVAVEATLTLRSATEVQRRPGAAAVADEEGTLEGPPADEPAGQDTFTRRLLVYLPGTVLGRVPGKAPDTLISVAAPPRPVYQPPQPPAAPPPQRGPLPGSLRAVLPEQWMRTGP